MEQTIYSKDGFLNLGKFTGLREVEEFYRGASVRHTKQARFAHLLEP